MRGGIRNVGNTCYVSSVLQALLAAAPLAEIATAPSAASGFLDALQSVSGAVRAGGTGDPTALLAAMRFVRGFDTGQQNDAHEFMIMLLQAWDEALRPSHGASAARWVAELPDERADRRVVDFVRQAHDSWRRSVASSSRLADIVNGQLVCQVTCAHCETPVQRFEEFSHLIVPCAASVGDALQRYMHPDATTDAAWTCERCRQNRPFVQSYWFTRLPPVLVVVVQRFDGQCRKATTRVRFDTHLQLAHFATFASDAPYRLSAVVCHTGGTSSGHYVCLVVSTDGPSVVCDDDAVLPAGSADSEATGYVAVYERIG